MVCCRAVCKNIVSLYALTLFNNRNLVEAGTLVGAHKLGDCEVLNSAAVVLNDNLVCRYTQNNAVLLGKHANARVNACLVFHTCADNRSLRLEKRNSLTLHVSTHQSTVCVVVFKERNHSRSYGYNHLRRYVHKVEAFSLKLNKLISVTAVYLSVYKAVILVKRFVSLCDNELVLDIGCHIYCFVRNNACFLVHTAERSFNKAVLVNLCKGCKIRDKSDVRSFRRFDRTHSAVVTVMNVTNLKSCTVS